MRPLAGVTLWLGGASAGGDLALKIKNKNWGDCPTSSGWVVLLPLLSRAADSRTLRLRVCVEHPVFPPSDLMLVRVAANKG